MHTHYACCVSQKFYMIAWFFMSTPPELFRERPSSRPVETWKGMESIQTDLTEVTRQIGTLKNTSAEIQHTQDSRIFFCPNPERLNTPTVQFVSIVAHITPGMEFLLPEAQDLATYTGTRFTGQQPLAYIVEQIPDNSVVSTLLYDAQPQTATPTDEQTHTQPDALQTLTVHRGALEGNTLLIEESRYYNYEDGGQAIYRYTDESTFAESPLENITVYSQDGCGFCSSLSDFLHKKTLPFTDISITQHPDQEQVAYQRCEYEGTPCTVIKKLDGTEIDISGFYPELISVAAEK